MASGYGQLGVLAQDRGVPGGGPPVPALLDISERLGNQAGMAVVYSQLGNLEKDRGGQDATAAIACHVKALAIRLTLGVPQAANNLYRLVEYRRELGAEQLTSLLTSITGSPNRVRVITSLLDRFGRTE